LLTPSYSADFPLQWLGECLIHYSTIYEGNPDTTNIRERFKYTFQDPRATAGATATAPASAPAAEAVAETNGSAMVTDTPMEAQPEINGGAVVENGSVVMEPALPMEEDSEMVGAS